MAKYAPTIEAPDWGSALSSIAGTMRQGRLEDEQRQRQTTLDEERRELQRKQLARQNMLDSRALAQYTEQQEIAKQKRDMDEIIALVKSGDRTLQEIGGQRLEKKYGVKYLGPDNAGNYWGVRKDENTGAWVASWVDQANQTHETSISQIKDSKIRNAAMREAESQMRIANAGKPKETAAQRVANSNFIATVNDFMNTGVFTIENPVTGMAKSYEGLNMENFRKIKAMLKADRGNPEVREAIRIAEKFIKTGVRESLPSQSVNTQQDTKGLEPGITLKTFEGGERFLWGYDDNDKLGWIPAPATMTQEELTKLQENSKSREAVGKKLNKWEQGIMKGVK